MLRVGVFCFGKKTEGTFMAFNLYSPKLEVEIFRLGILAILLAFAIVGGWVL